MVASYMKPVGVVFWWVFKVNGKHFVLREPTAWQIKEVKRRGAILISDSAKSDDQVRRIVKAHKCTPVTRRLNGLHIGSLGAFGSPD